MLALDNDHADQFNPFAKDDVSSDFLRQEVAHLETTVDIFIQRVVELIEEHRAAEDARIVACLGVIYGVPYSERPSSQEEEAVGRLTFYEPYVSKSLGSGTGKLIVNGAYWATDGCPRTMST